MAGDREADPDRDDGRRRRRGKDYPTLHEDERDPAFDTYRVAAPEGPPPEGQRSKDDLEAQSLGGHPKHDGRDTLREDERDPAYDRMPIENPDAPPPERD
ncbi:MAG TPA: hypothetical protein VFW74_09250 [Acidimicrobiia bacterium]|nr:hypothetical protein [Acidimicrobiia bacterium]